MPSPTMVEGLPQAAEGTGSYGNRFFYTNFIMTPTGVALQTTAEQSVTVGGLLATDMIVSINKPTLNAGIAVTQSRISAASTLALTFVNAATASVTPTGSQQYLLLIYRPNI